MTSSSETNKPSRFARFGAVLVRRRTAALLLSVAFVAAAGAFGVQAFGRLDSGGYSNNNSDAVKVADYLHNTLKQSDPAVALIVHTPRGNIDEPSVTAIASRLAAKVSAEAGAEKVVSYWSTGRPPTLRSDDGKSAYMLVYLATQDFTKVADAGGAIQAKFDGEFEGLDVYATGTGVFAHAVNGRISKDLALAESVAIPLTFILLLIVFGTLIASVTPLVVGVVSILGTVLVLYLLTQVTTVSIFAVNLTTGLGLGLGIDYALLIVNRFREELRAGKSRDEAVIETVATAGRTVFYSGLTVLLTLSALLFFPINFLKSMGYAGMAVVILAVASALVTLPAILAVIGAKVDMGKVLKSSIEPSSDGMWARLARVVMRRPVPVVLVSGLALLALMFPVSHTKFGQIDSRSLPSNDPAYVASAFADSNFSGQAGTPITIVFPGRASDMGIVRAFVNSVGKLPGVTTVVPPETQGADAVVSVIHSMRPRTDAAMTLVSDIRSLPHPPGMLVGGFAADYLDTRDGVTKSLPWVILWISLAILLMLFLFTGSVLMPLKTLLLAGLSLFATVGLLTTVFIDGHLTFLVGSFTNTGDLDMNNLILVLIVAFALSMDYEIFLLSRIREEHMKGLSNTESVAVGLQRSARLITAAALILAVNFAAFIVSGVSAIKMLGLGVAFAILLDATLIRAFLVPALMRLLGEANWWAPKALRRFSITH